MHETYLIKFLQVSEERTRQVSFMQSWLGCSTVRSKTNKRRQVEQLSLLAGEIQEAMAAGQVQV